MGLAKQEYQSGLPFPSPGDLPDPGIEPESPALTGRFFTTEPPGKPTLALRLVPNSQIQPTAPPMVLSYTFTIEKKKSVYNWTHAVQTHIVQGSTVNACYIIRNREDIFTGVGGGEGVP